MKKIAVSLLAALTLSTAAMSALAAESVPSDVTAPTTVNLSVSDADSLEMNGKNSNNDIVYYYRYYNGVKQYRKWSTSQGKWVSDWTNC